MERIIDIYGSSADYDDIYRPDNSWFGTVLVDDNNYLKGVVEDYYEQIYHLVFGKISESDISLIKCSNEDATTPQSFTANRDDRKYYGDYFAKTRNAEVALGECQISYIPAEVTREETEEEKAYIRERISIVTQRLGNNGKELLEDHEKVRLEQAEKVV